MIYEDLFKKIRNLAFDKREIIYKENGTELYVIRPSKLSARFKNYDLKKNFQIWLKEENREFRPNHLRVFIDLHLRARSRPDLTRDLLKAFDKIFYGEDPNTAIEHLKKEGFEHFLNSIGVIANLSQLFIVEQAYGYNKESNYEPPTLFFQGWVRQSIADSKEIDNICMSVANGQPPLARYTNYENRKGKKYRDKLKDLWYLEETS